MNNAVQYGEFSRLYDTFMSDVDYDGWASYVIDLLNAEGVAAPMRVVDCACGTGAISIRLKRAGFDVTGTDISDEMLAVAAQNARTCGIAVPFVCMDMRKIILHKRAHAVVSVCDGVNYLTSLRDVSNFFAAAYNNLADGGVLLFDISSEYKLRRIVGDNTFAEESGDGAYIWQNAFDGTNKLIEMELTFFVREGDGRYRRFAERHLQRAHSVSELTQALERAGFARISVYECFTRDNFGEKSERIQFVAIKPKVAAGKE